MIVFDLQCARQHHVFEAWFGSSTDFDDQKARGLLQCPICGDADISKAVMAPAVSAKGNQTRHEGPGADTSHAESSGPAAPPAPVAAMTTAPAPAEIKALLAAMAKAQAEAIKHSTWVGKDFTDQARAMHDGDITPQPIYGQASLADARDLLDDGIDIMPLPFPVRPPGIDN